MRVLDVSNASATVVQPIKAGTMSFLQAAYKAGMNDIVASLFGFDPTVSPYNALVWVLFGCKGTGPGTMPTSVTAGAIMLNGEIFEVAAATLSYLGGQVAICNVLTTQDATDPLTFSNQQQYKVHNIRTIAIVAGTSGAGTVCDFSALLTPLQSIPTITSNIATEINRAETSESVLQNNINHVLDPILASWVLRSNVADVTLNGGSGTAVSYSNINYKINGTTMMMNFNIAVSNTTQPTRIDVIIPTGAILDSSDLWATCSCAIVSADSVQPSAIKITSGTGVFHIYPTGLTHGTTYSFCGQLTFPIN